MIFRELCGVVEIIENIASTQGKLSIFGSLNNDAVGLSQNIKG